MTGPLTGYRIIDFTTALAGPWAAGILCDQGAEVIKVERFEGDIARSAGTTVGDISAMFHMANRGKQSIAVDLKSAEGREIARTLAGSADVVVQNFRPGVAQRLGLDYQQLREVREDIIVVAVSGFGPTGPDAGRAAFDSVVQAESGISDLQAGDDGVPRFAEHTVVDKVTAMAAAQATVVALLARERGHGGQLVDVPMLDTAVGFLWMDVAGGETLLDAAGQKDRGVAGGRRYFLELIDGWCSISLGRPGDYAVVARALGLDVDRYEVLNPQTGDTELAEQFRADLREVASKLTREEIAGKLRGSDVIFGIVRTLADMHLNPQLQDVGLFVETEQPGVGRIRQPRGTTRFSAFAPHEPPPSAHIGEHTAAVLEEIGLGARAAELRARGVIA